MKYIIVTGGVISSIGKGVISSSIGNILKHFGLEVTAIKIDPYINIDAGTFSPYEHGEVFVLDDGGEVDVDLGNYERFLDIVLRKDNNITTGKIYSAVIEKERRGDFLGKTVQVVPHITDAIQDWIERVAKQPVCKELPEVCIVELGGTIGDIESMPYVEALRQFQFRVEQNNICFIHVSLVPEVSSTSEHKTKPTQSSVRDLRSQGLSPDIIVCRSQRPIDDKIKKKISSFCNVSPEKVIGLHDADTIYSVPLILEMQNMSTILSDKLGLQLLQRRPANFMLKWKKLAKRSKHLIDSVSIAVVGKYTKVNSTEAYASVIKALEHAALACRRKLHFLFVEAEYLESPCKTDKPAKYFDAWKKISESKGILVPGGFGSRGMEGKIAVCQWARENKCPFLGICLGMQTAVIEFARNVLGWEDACSQEMTANGGRHVVIEMPEHNPGQMGGTMRLGRRTTQFNGKPSKLQSLYHNAKSVDERHRHRYEVNPDYVSDFEKANMVFVGQDESGERMEIVEYTDHPYFVGVQYHPEYLSRLLKPSPPYLGLILAACDKLNAYLANSYQLSDSDDELEHLSKK